MKETIAIVIFIAVAGTWLYVVDKRDQKLMEMCADHETQTLYEC